MPYGTLFRIELVGPLVITPDECVWACTYPRTLSTLYIAPGLSER